MRALLAPDIEVQPDHVRGLDHGIWSILVKAYPLNFGSERKVVKADAQPVSVEVR